MLEEGSTFGRYRIERELGAGGMGSVYAAQDTVLRRTVALKVVRTTDDEDAGARLLREARAAAALRHPNAVAVFDIGENEGIPFIAMELVTGSSLSSFVGDESCSIEKRLEWLAGMARALAAAHRAGIVHRDVKPDNVMIQDDGTVKVLDFGIAKRAGVAAPALASSGDGPPSFRTKEGVIIGTPRYMAPEQLTGAAVDARADQFAWAVVAYELLSGVHPQSTTGTAERWGAPPKPLREIAPEVPAEVSNVVMRALERWPDHRWPSMADVLTTLGDPETVQTSHEVSPSPTEPTMRFVTETKPTAPLLPRTIVDGTIADPHRPLWRRLLVPVAGLTSMFAGIAVMLVVIVIFGGETTPMLGKALIRIGWVGIALAPLFALSRGPRRARLAANLGQLEVRGARGMSQTISASSIAGASLAPTGTTGRFTVVIAPKRVGTIPIVIDVPSEDDAHAVLGALGVVDGRAITGLVSWPLFGGRFRFVIGLVWRVAMVLTFVPSALVSGLAFLVTLLSGVLAAGLAFAPWMGAHVELTPDQLRIVGHGPAQVIPLREVDAVSMTGDVIDIRARDGRTSSFRASLLTLEERAHLVRHIDAATIRARAGWIAPTAA